MINVCWFCNKQLTQEQSDYQQVQIIPGGVSACQDHLTAQQMVLLERSRSHPGSTLNDMYRNGLQAYLTNFPEGE